MHVADNVAIVANDGGLPAGTVFADGLTLLEKVPQGHKVSLVDIASGAPVRRYNVVIGNALRDIPAGSEVVISNFWLWRVGVGPQNGFEATNCAGRILLEIVLSNNGGATSFPISFTDCADVWIHWCRLTAE